MSISHEFYNPFVFLIDVRYVHKLLEMGMFVAGFRNLIETGRNWDYFWLNYKIRSLKRHSL